MQMTDTDTSKPIQTNLTLAPYIKAKLAKAQQDIKAVTGKAPTVTRIVETLVDDKLESTVIKLSKI